MCKVAEVSDVSLCLVKKFFTACTGGMTIGGIGEFHQNDFHNGGRIEGVLTVPETMRGKMVTIHFNNRCGEMHMSDT